MVLEDQSHQNLEQQLPTLGTWSSLLDDANGVQQEIGTYYFKLEADLSVYDSSQNLQTYCTIRRLGKVIMRLIYYP
jgi:hypothetical protein